MHFTEYWSILERGHEVLNPVSPEKLARLAGYCGLRDGQRVLDVGSGKGWLLCRWAKEWEIQGTGLEVNPRFVSDARQRAVAEGVADRVAFVEGPALQFHPEPESFDVVLCIGASFALGGFDAALPWMRRALRPDGALAIGEPFLHEWPLPREARGGAPEWAAQLRDLPGTVGALEANGLECSALIAVSLDDWDAYYSGHWTAASEWGRQHPEHPDREELVRQVRQARESYLRWERRYTGWGIFVARAV